MIFCIFSKNHLRIQKKSNNFAADLCSNHYTRIEL